MPVVLRVGPYKFNFFSEDGKEPPHVHIKGGGGKAKFWLNPISLASNKGFKPHELNKLEKLIEQNQALLLKKWSEYFYESKN